MTEWMNPFFQCKREFVYDTDKRFVISKISANTRQDTFSSVNINRPKNQINSAINIDKLQGIADTRPIKYR